MSKKTVKLPDWEQVLSSAAQLQRIIPEAVLVGGSAAAIHAEHRVSTDADHVLTDLRTHFENVLTKLEKEAGWKTAKLKQPVIILGNLDGIMTGVRQLIRKEPLETVVVNINGEPITLPSEPEMLRIKAVLILKRNAARDYIDFAALAEHLGDEKSAYAMRDFDLLYPQESGESSLQQLLAQLSHALPFDLINTDLKNYKNLKPQYQDWNTVFSICANMAQTIFEKTLSLTVNTRTGLKPKP